MIYEQQNGVLDWVGRYALIQSDFAKAIASKFFNQDNTQANDRKFRKESKHLFFVRQTSMFRLYLNTLDSNVKVRYSIMNSEHEVVASEAEYLDSTVGFGMLTPLDPHEGALDAPFTLLLEYEHEHGKRDLGAPECPKIELHFVMEPAHFHTESL